MAEQPSAIEIVRTRSLASLVAEEIERMILSGEIPGGERLNEVALAARLRVSRGPVREAIRGLEGSGLVVTVVNQGSYVRQVTAEEALGMYDIRAALTGYACLLLAGSIADTQLAELHGLIGRMAAAEAANDPGAYYPLNREFHGALMGFAGNARAQRICEDIGNELNLFRRRALVPAENMRDSNAEHAEIIDAIAAGDAERARRAGEAHILGGKRRFVATRPAADATTPPEPQARRASGASPPPPG